MYFHQQVKDNLVIKSGADFRNLSLVTIEERQPGPGDALQAVDPETGKSPLIDDKNVETDKAYQYFIKGKYVATVIKMDITQQTPADPKVTEHIAFHYSELDKQLKEVVCHLDSDSLDVTFSSIRSKEAAIGNFLADLMRKEHQADCAVINSGTLRADKVYNTGPLLQGDIEDILPFLTAVCLAELTGEQLIQVLENSVSKLPALEGRFLQVAHIDFHFDLSKPAGMRVKRDTVIVDKKPIDLTRRYKMACSGFVMKGKEGFDVLNETVHLIDVENAPELKTVVMKFMGILNLRRNDPR